MFIVGGERESSNISKTVENVSDLKLILNARLISEQRELSHIHVVINDLKQVFYSIGLLITPLFSLVEG